MEIKDDATSKEKQAYWVGIINEARNFPGGVSEYCRTYNISKPNYYQWFRRLRSRHARWKVDLSQKKRKGTKAGVVSSQTEVTEKAKRRTFSAADKERILKAADEAPAGQIGAVLRREGVYASHLQKWRKEQASLEPKQRGPKADPQAKQIKELKAANARLLKKLSKAEQLIDLQKKVSEILGVTLKPVDLDEEDLL